MYGIDTMSYYGGILGFVFWPVLGLGSSEPVSEA